MFRTRVKLGGCILCAITCTSESARADGFPINHLILTDYSNVYAVDPLTGASQLLLAGQTGLGDIIYNPVTDSAFIGTGSDAGGPEILELKWDVVQGFTVRIFVDGLNHAHGLAVDSAGNIYFGQHDQRIWKADPAGNIAPVTDYDFYYFFTTEYMAFSADESKLCVSVCPSNQVDLVTFPGASLSHLTEDVSFPRGIDVATDSTVYVAEGQRISAVSPAGVVSTYAQEPWMANLFGDIEFDDRDEMLYVISAYHLYTLDSDRNPSLLFSNPAHLALKGLDFIVPEPATLLLFSLGGMALRRRRGL